MLQVRLVAITRRMSLWALTSALCFVGLAQAQDWPQRPVRIIGPYAAGGNADVLARLTAQWLSDAIGKQFIVENRVGGNGMIAAEAVARSPADGYTMLWGVLPPIAIQPAMTKVPYDSIKDFAPVSVVATNPFVLVVNKDIPVNSVAEFIAWVSAQPSKRSYAEGGVGSVTHLAMAIFLKRGRPRNDQCQLPRQCAGADRHCRRAPANDVLEPVGRTAAFDEWRDPRPRGVE